MANLEYSTEKSCKVICQNLTHKVPKGRDTWLLGLSPTDMEILSTTTAETNNHGQENLDGAQEGLLPEDWGIHQNVVRTRQ